MTRTLETFQAPAGPVALRQARREDVSAVVALLIDDQLGRGRDSLDDLIPHLAAFDAIAADPAHLLLVRAETDGTVTGTSEFSVLPGLSRRGASRAQVEAVRIAAHRFCERLGSSASHVGMELTL